jgi:c-di-GMP-binding flagellar brake protein YcgR
MADKTPDQPDIPFTFGIADAADESRFVLHSRLEIAAILRSMQSKKNFVTAYFDQSGEFFLTSIITVDEDKDRVILDCSPDRVTNSRAAQSNKIVFVATKEQARVQFIARSLHLIQHEGRDAFSMPLPDALLRLQRREYFRVATPVVKPLSCFFPVAAENKIKEIEVTIVDISCGGAAIIDHRGIAGLQVGMRFDNCRIPLPEIGTIVVDILIRDTFEVTLKGGVTDRRLSAEFVQIPERDQALIQRYINKIERERLSRTPESS